MILRRATLSLVVTLVPLFGSRCVASDCQPLSSETQTRIVKYLDHRLFSAGSSAQPLRVTATSLVPESCFWKIELAISAKTRRVVYLSPDQRFLSAGLYDLESDPDAEVLRIAREVSARLMKDSSPIREGSSPKLTIVEFGDLQCPFCKNFEVWFQQLPSEVRSQTRLVFKHFPLPQHAWASKAAAYSACAASQSSDLFWRLVDGLLAVQNSITVENLDREAMSVLPRQDLHRIDELKTCVASGAGADIVDRDIAVGRDLAVTSTPTIFINGRRVLNINSEQTLQQVINRFLNKNEAP